MPLMSKFHRNEKRTRLSLGPIRVAAVCDYVELPANPRWPVLAKLGPALQAPR
jgi:hypothetical protein